MLLILLLIIFLTGWGFAEYRRHKININRIPVRIHINGSRGKSSVTRLIGAALRESDKTIFTKTTGTSPRMIFPDGKEYPVIRAGKPNINEQVGVIRKALELGTEVLVTECMAVQPVLQKFVEEKMIRSTIGLITNIRPDHVDEMGPTMDDIEKSICGTVPKNGCLFTAEKYYNKQMRKVAAERNTEFILVDGETVSDAEMEGFPYIEHKDNVALALTVCERLGINRQSSLRGMKQAEPDSGALKIYDLEFFEKRIKFVNAFAANDPESYKIIWKMLNIRTKPERKVIALVNSRRDRIQRAEQLGELIAKDIDADYYVIAGEYTRALVQKAISLGLNPDKLIEIGDEPVDDIFERTISLVEKEAIIIGIGNIVGFGNDIAMVFINRGQESVSRNFSN
ncbi:MAG: poly-gamma-glutamate synthase PgsB [candidate division Zixibacteria bacterium]|nr:poly-gamma-glutamate synthase PgsB [candidate division Zixibacteria bacterium]